ncbi:hypothetical protein BJV77DRAFT_967494 [Russula vinacea]|nr:hypothetical protein BJV77DRAFT_967494 [Russula vinacea]
MTVTCAASVTYEQAKQENFSGVHMAQTDRRTVCYYNKQTAVPTKLHPNYPSASRRHYTKLAKLLPRSSCTRRMPGLSSHPGGISHHFRDRTHVSLADEVVWNVALARRRLVSFVELDAGAMLKVDRKSKMRITHGRHWHVGTWCLPVIQKNYFGVTSQGSRRVRTEQFQGADLYQKVVAGILYNIRVQAGYGYDTVRPRSDPGTIFPPKQTSDAGNTYMVTYGLGLVELWAQHSPSLNLCEAKPGQGETKLGYLI